MQLRLQNILFRSTFEAPFFSDEVLSIHMISHPEKKILPKMNRYILQILLFKFEAELLIFNFQNITLIGTYSWPWIHLPTKTNFYKQKPTYTHTNTYWDPEWALEMRVKRSLRLKNNISVFIKCLFRFQS